MTIEEKIEAKRNYVIHVFDYLPLHIISEVEFVEQFKNEDLELPMLPMIHRETVRGRHIYKNETSYVIYRIQLTGSGAFLKESLPTFEEDNDCKIDPDNNEIFFTLKLERNSGYNPDSYFKDNFKIWFELTENKITKYNNDVYHHNSNIDWLIKDVYNKELSGANYFKQNYNPF